MAREPALRALRSRTFLGYTAVFGFAFAVMMAYISASPFLYQDMIGFGTVGYGLAFGLNALALMGVSILSAKLTSTRSVTGVLSLGIVLVLASTVAFALLVVSGAPVIWLAVPLFTAVGLARSGARQRHGARPRRRAVGRRQRLGRARCPAVRGSRRSCPRSSASAARTPRRRWRS